MKASVIIPTRNRAPLLRGALGSLVQQSIPTQEFEVVVVDNGSTDATADVCKEFSGQLNLSYVREEEPGLHAGRHAGIRRSRTDILMFADDDIRASPTWVEAVVRCFRTSDVGLVGGNNLPDFESPPPEWLDLWWQQGKAGRRHMAHLSILDFGLGRFEIDPGFVWGCNFSIRRELVLRAGGFHPDALPEALIAYRGDGETHVSDMVRRSGLRTMFDSDATVHHRVPTARMSPGYLARRSFAQGISTSYADIRRHGGLGDSATAALACRIRTLAGGFAARVRAARPGASLVSRTLESVRGDCAMAHAAGYAFHRREARRNPELLAWVLKPTYLP